MTPKTVPTRTPEGQELVAAALSTPRTAPHAGAVWGAIEAVMGRTGFAKSEIRWSAMLPIEQNRLKEALALANGAA